MGLRSVLKVWWRMRRVKKCDTESGRSPECTSPDGSSLVDKLRLLTSFIHKGHGYFALKLKVAFSGKAASCCRRRCLHHRHENDADEPRSCWAMIPAPVITFDHTRRDNNIVVAFRWTLCKAKRWFQTENVRNAAEVTIVAVIMMACLLQSQGSGWVSTSVGLFACFWQHWTSM